jgi:hypothetical protein
VSERFTTTTTVRRPRTLLLWTVAGLMAAFFIADSVFRMHALHGLGALPYWVMGPLIAAIQRRPKIDRAAIDASPEGLRIGDALMPRAKLKSAVLRREYDHSYVLLRGGGLNPASVDVEVSSDEEADRLCRALTLDAASTTAEFTLFRRGNDTKSVTLLMALIAAGVGVGVASARTHLAHMALPFVMVAIFALMVPVLFVTRRTKLRVGADGIALREGLSRRRFIGHDEIERVTATGTEVAIERKNGERIAWNVGGSRQRKKKKRSEDLERQAQSIVWRIEKAREAYAALAGGAPQAALALDRGQKTAREWLDQLRAIGAGAGATFRSAQLTREQLLRIVESTTAAAKERIAAAAALHDALTEEEKPRIRVAADRCAAPALGEAMVRVALAPSDEDLEVALEEATRIEADAAP